MDGIRSASMFKKAKKYFPGGVNSPVRAFKSVGSGPVYFSRGKGQYVYDIDGNRYLDFIGAWGPAVLGHADKAAVDAVKKAASKGLCAGLNTASELRLAVEIKKLLPWINMMRFVNSGTEAVMTAVRLARAFTGRDMIIKMSGCYHGHLDSMLVSAGSGALTYGVPDSPGITKAAGKDTIAIPFNDIVALEKTFAKYGNKIAALILEPVAGNMGVVPAKESFIKKAGLLCKKYNSVLIFDEIMAGFRAYRRTGKEHYKVEPGLVCLGKIIGGGLPVGVVAGKKEIMSMLAPSGPVYQAGTFSGNPVVMEAGAATLRAYVKQETFKKIDKSGQVLDAMLGNAPGIHYARSGGMFTLFFTNVKVTDLKTAKTSDTAAFAKFHRFMMSNNILLPPSQFEACFISSVHEERQMEVFGRKCLEFIRNCR